jgi:hypothetical protein
MRGPNLTGLGYRPDLTPSHQVDLLTGIGPCGAMMEGSLTKPVSGSAPWFDIDCIRPIHDGAILACAASREVEFG